MVFKQTVSEIIKAGGGDWFWAKYGADFKILKEGKVKGCLDCHSSADENDFIFTGTVK